MTELVKVGPSGVVRAELVPFKNEAQDFEGYLANHLELIAPDMRLLARQLATAGGDRLDILAAAPMPTGMFQPVIIELKNVRADANVLVQCLRYANWLRANPDSVRLYAKAEDIEVDVSSPKVILVAPEIDGAVMELAGYTTGNLDLEFIELRRFLVRSDEFFVIDRRGASLTEIAGTSRQETWSWEKYEHELKIKPEAIGLGRQLFGNIETTVAEHRWQLVPVFRKWYVAFQRDGSNRFGLEFPSTSRVDLWVRLPRTPAELRLPTREADGQRWDGKAFVSYPWKASDSLDSWMPYLEHAMTAS